jgi:hypothetical protein
MALEVEDGTAKANAESYALVSEADTYLAARGHTSWAALAEAAKEAALRLATDYMVQAYRLRWKSWRYTRTQALDWPRSNVILTDNYSGAMGYDYIANNVVPNEVKNACIELALKASNGALTEDLTPQVQSETVGPISTSYFQGGQRITTYPAIDRMLAPFLKSDGAMVVSRS